MRKVRGKHAEASPERFLECSNGGESDQVNDLVHEQRRAFEQRVGEGQPGGHVRGLVSAVASAQRGGGHAVEEQNQSGNTLENVTAGANRRSRAR
ncbi:MAG TPA: hypothetical protein VGP93_01365 [Polyangiaceae bacterium]|nr:hypothetical protein [Polyangiaceae bacterium]